MYPKLSKIFSDDSDDPSGLIDHLPRRLLGAHAEKRKRKRVTVGSKGDKLQASGSRLQAGSDSEGDEGEEDEGVSGQWSKKSTGLVGSKTPSFTKPVLTAADRDTLESLTTAYSYYKIFQPDSFVNNVVYQSKLYAVQKNYTKAMDIITCDTYRCTEAMLLHSGYHSIPSRRMMWEEQPDCWNKMVAENIRRDEVDAVLKCLHFRDNTKIDDDGYFKVRWSLDLPQCLDSHDSNADPDPARISVDYEY
jgi:hypothetical protein